MRLFMTTMVAAMVAAMVRAMRAAMMAAIVAACSGTGGPVPSDGDAKPSDDGGESADGPTSPSKPRVILVVADGLGRQLELASSLFASGTPSAFAWHQFPHRGELLTESASGITDSAAAATSISTGEITYNGRLGFDTMGVAPEGLFERAAQRNMSAGIVTTTAVTHATPAAFTARAFDRYDTDSIAEQQLAAKLAVMLGGGRSDFSDDQLADSDASVVATAQELAAVDGDVSRVIGLFAPGALPFVTERGPEIPGLATMTRKALEVLDRNPFGFLLVVEAGRIDRAAHDQNLARAVNEVVELDATVNAILDWSRASGPVTLVLASDHETGGLHVESPGGAGELSSVSWRWGRHTGARVGVFALGPMTAALDSELGDHRTLHRVLSSALTGEPVTDEPRVAVANGELSDLRFVVASQNQPTDLGTAGRLDSLRIDADARAITIGLEGTFSMTSSSLVVFVDRDFGSDNGAATLVSQSSTSTDPVDQLLSRAAIDFSPIAGFRADFAAVSVAGTEEIRESPWPGAGWRALDAGGGPIDPPLAGIAISYDDGVRGQHGPAVSRPDSGAEVGIDFQRLFPESGGQVPVGAQVAVIAVMTSVLGGSLSNQALPPFDAGTQTLTTAVVINLDVDLDGVVDLVPTIVPTVSLARLPERRTNR